MTAGDRAWLLALLRERWGGETVVAHGEAMRPADLPGFVAVDPSGPVGVAAYQFADGGCELVLLESLAPGRGVGSALLGRVERAAVERGCPTVWIVTTNDNLRALAFYQNRGYRLVRVNPGAVDRARVLKPTIPLVGESGIPLHDELVLAKRLDAAGGTEDR